MKLLKVTNRTLGIICVAVILGIICSYFLSGIVVQLVNTSGQITTIENHTLVVPLINDTSFEVKEANLSVVLNWPTNVSVTYDDLKMFPELEQSMQGVNNDPNVWFIGWRLVKDFDGNRSQYVAVLKEICKGKSSNECNSGSLFEYHGQYYLVSLDYLDVPNPTPHG